MLKKKRFVLKNASCRWNHPDANGRAVDFDEKSRRKRTGADAKMCRVAGDALNPLPSVQCAARASLVPIFSAVLCGLHPVAAVALPCIATVRTVLRRA
jgi:hypothetical protein